ncbi:MAG TPA: WHG domain-containing protein [Stellaceae bacterium]|nr:WHG domain-containing protein [Stellaceae bacterium]
MLQAAGRILDRDGIQGLTLRAAAREAGASHAAPKNHFDDLTGLLSELATIGFNRFTERLITAAETSPQHRLSAIGRAYVDFAVASPGLFQLMFRSERLDVDRPALREAMQRASGVLSDTVGTLHPESTAETPALAKIAHMVAAWSMVHGFAMLLLDGRLTPILERLPEGDDATILLNAILCRC